MFHSEVLKAVEQSMHSFQVLLSFSVSWTRLSFSWLYLIWEWNCVPHAHLNSVITLGITSWCIWNSVYFDSKVNLCFALTFIFQVLFPAVRFWKKKDTETVYMFCINRLLKGKIVTTVRNKRINMCICSKFIPPLKHPLTLISRYLFRHFQWSLDMPIHLSSHLAIYNKPDLRQEW